MPQHPPSKKKDYVQKSFTNLHHSCHKCGAFIFGDNIVIRDSYFYHTEHAPEDHEHEFFGTYLRTIGGEKFVMYSGELDTDEYVKMCDCGEIENA